MVNVILTKKYIEESWDGKTSLEVKEKILGTFFDDQEAQKWAESEKENNPIFEEGIDENGDGITYELILEKVKLIDKNFHVDESLLKF